MKRILFDIPKWDAMLHREHRGLARPRAADAPRLRLEDELFERLYAGGADPLDASDVDPGLRPWAERVHATCDELPDFARLAATCRGDASAAALAVESLLSDVPLDDPDAPSPPEPQPPAAAGRAGGPGPGAGKNPLRKPVSEGCAAAAAAVDDLREALEGLAQVAEGAGAPGTASAPAQPGTPPRTVEPLARRLRHDARLRRIALLAGRLKRIAANKRRQKLRHGADELADVEQGAELSRVLPSELAKLTHPRRRLEFMRSLLERQALQYRLAGAEQLGRGPLVLLLDKSSSMEGPRDLWATALGLALLQHAQAERRAFALLAFNHGVIYSVVVEPGGQLPHDALYLRCDGGTSLAAAIERGLDLIASREARPLAKSDLVLITDGESPDELAPSLRERARAMGVSILGLAVGQPAAALAAWCDEAHAVDDLSTVHDELAAGLFAA